MSCNCKCHKVPKAIAWELYRLGDEYSYGSSFYVKTKKEAEAIFESEKIGNNYYGPYDGIKKITSKSQLLYKPYWIKK